MALDLRFRNQDIVLDATGALLFATSGTMVVSDLHFEKGSHFAGSPLPPYDTRQTLIVLGETIANYQPCRVVCLGDSFHDPAAPDRLHDSDRAALAALTAATEWIWVCGNHDPEPPEDLGGKVCAEVAENGLCLRHVAAADVAPAAVSGEVSGHYHPVATVRTRARTMSRCCFVTDGRRLVLPAFDAYAGGLNVLDEAITSLFVQPMRTYVVSGDRVLRMPLRNLRRPPRRLA